jgi:hypothetical protein
VNGNPALYLVGLGCRAWPTDGPYPRGFQSFSLLLAGRYWYSICNVDTVPEMLVWDLKYWYSTLTFWRRNYFFNFRVKNTGTKQVRIIKQTAF